MTQWQSEIMSPWVVRGDGERVVRVTQDFAGITMSDTSCQPSANLTPDPNLMTCLVTCEEAVLDAIEADADYLVLWSEEIAEEEI